VDNKNYVTRNQLIIFLLGLAFFLGINLFRVFIIGVQVQGMRIQRVKAGEATEFKIPTPEDNIKAITKEIKLRPQSWYFYKDRAAEYCKIKDYNNALKDIDIAIKGIEPVKDASYYEAQAKYYYKLKNYQASINSLDQAIKYNALEDDYPYYKGCLQVKIKDYQGALSSLETASKKSMGLSVGCLVCWGQVYELLGDRENALAKYLEGSKVLDSMSHFPKKIAPKLEARFAGDWEKHKGWIPYGKTDLFEPVNLFNPFKEEE